jgi:hypothetical protein
MKQFAIDFIDVVPSEVMVAGHKLNLSLNGTAMQFTGNA